MDDNNRQSGRSAGICRAQAHIIRATPDGTLAGVATLFSILLSLNLLLFTFNLIPLPPLDGSSIIALLLSSERAVSYMDLLHLQPSLLHRHFHCLESIWFSLQPYISCVCQFTLSGIKWVSVAGRLRP